MIEPIQERLTDQQRQFLLSFKQGGPECVLVNLPDIEDLPAVQ